MFYLKKTLLVSASHRLDLDYESPCHRVHGHNWRITVFLRRSELDASGMILDFTVIKRTVKGALDHKNLNDVLDCNPTAENIARWVCNAVPFCYRVEVEETPGSVAIYEED